MARCGFGEGCSRSIIYKNDESRALKASKYCEKHTCIGFAGEDPCFRKIMKAGETRCISHVQCKAALCQEARMVAANGGWWDCCIKHKCKNNECMQLQQYYNVKERYLKFCGKHKCVKPDCESEADKPGPNGHCKAHDCSEDTCSSIIEANEKLCALHLKCRSTNCTKKRVLKGNQYQAFCVAHILCNAPNCAKEKQSNSHHCKNHTCFKRDCDREADSINFYCSEHTCVTVNCNNPRLYHLDSSPQKSDYCAIHECRKEGCLNASRHATFGFCPSHNCDKPDCTNLKLIDPGSPKPLTLCLKHYDESRNPLPTLPPVPKPAPAPRAVTPPLPKPDLTLDALEALRREQRSQRDKLDDIYSLIERRLFR